MLLSFYDPSGVNKRIRKRDSQMIDLNFDLKTGKLIFDDLTLENVTEEYFFKSPLYQVLSERNAVKSLMPHNYHIDSVLFLGKEFEVSIRPISVASPFFVVSLVDKHSDYYKSLTDWYARTNIEMLNESVKDLAEWFKEKLNLDEPEIIEVEMIRWGFDWGRLSVSYETYSFFHGAYIAWYFGG